jgi:hypothetical protein
VPRSGLSAIVATVCLVTAVCVPTPAALAATGLAMSGGPLPLAFEPNLGQAEAPVKFLSRGRGYGLFLTPTEAVVVLAPPGRVGADVRRPRAATAAPDSPPAVVRLRLIGADPAATLSGVDVLAGRSHYVLGQPAGRPRDVPRFARVRYDSVYPGVTLIFYGREGQLEYDFVLAPGADPAAIVFAVEGAAGARLHGDGDLLLGTSAGEVRLRRPVIYQDIGGARRLIDGGYLLDGDRVRFRVAAWDPAHPLVIDPVLGYSTHLGGSSNDQGFGIAVDADGSAYVTGNTISSNFPVSSAPAQPTRAGVTDAFVAKLDPAGALVYATFLGGSGDDAGNAVAVDAAGNAYVAGTTTSTNFPVRAAFQPTLRGSSDAFVAKLDPSGSLLVYSTYLGSNTEDTANGVALDAAGNAYVTGSTASPAFPNNAAVTCLGTKRTGNDAFVARLDASGSTLGYCRFIGGAGIDVGQGVAADATGNVWLVGVTTSNDLGVQAALQPTFGGRTDGFVGRLDRNGAVVYLTYLGGSGDDLALAVAVDAAGNAYVTGSAASADFPTTAPLQALPAGGDDAFVAKLTPTGSALVFATLLGGTGDDVGNGIAVRASDSSVYVAGATGSLDFPTTSPIQPALAGRVDAFVTRLNAAGSALLFSTYLGGPGDDVAQALAVDADGVAYVTGVTNSPAFPTSAPIQTAAGLLDAFVTQIADGGVIQFTATGYQVSENGGSVAIGVQRIGDTGPAATVQIAASNGTATAGSDYGTAGSATPPSRTLTFASGQTTATFLVPILPDTRCDGDETVNLTLANPGGGSALGTRRTAVLTILEPNSCITFDAAAYSVAENRGSGLVTVVRSGSAAGTVTVQLSTSDGTATAPADYGAVVNRTLTFPTGARSLTVAIPVVNDALVEGAETVSLALSGVQGAAVLGAERRTTSLTIVDDDLAGTVQFSRAVFTVSETAARATITVTRTGGAAGGVTVDFATSNGTASAGADYAATTGTLTFKAGAASATFTVPIVNDTATDPDETVNLTLSNPGGGAVLGVRPTAVLTIADNEPRPGVVQLSQAVYSASESGTSAKIVVTRAGGTAGGVTVDYQASDGTATGGGAPGGGIDYMTTSGTLTFNAGVTSLTFTVPVFGDTIAEGNETVLLGLANPTGGATLGARATATLRILDDEASVQFAASTYTVAEGATASIVVERTGTAGTVIVQYATGDGTGIAGTDYVARTGALTFGAGVRTLSIPVRTIANTSDEGDRTVNLALSGPVSGTAGAILAPQAIAVLTIVDNDAGGQIQFSAATYTVSEATRTASLSLVRTGGLAGPVTVNVATVDGTGTATAGVDYTPVAQIVTFPAGATARTVAVPIAHDTLDEPNETIVLQLSSPAGGATLGVRDAAVLTIVDND